MAALVDGHTPSIGRRGGLLLWVHNIFFGRHSPDNASQIMTVWCYTNSIIIIFYTRGRYIPEGFEKKKMRKN